MVLAALLAGCGGTGPNEPRVGFIDIKYDSTVKSPFRLAWGAENFTIEPAGKFHELAGHLHVMINAGCIPASEVVPSDETHLHFGKAQTETDLDLAPGTYTLCLQAADGAHLALDEDGMTQVIRLTVEE